MALMEGVLKIGGVWKIRRRIPTDCLADFGVKEAYTRSLGTADRKLAIQLATPILKEIDDRIAAIRAGRNPPVQTTTEMAAFAPLDRARAFDLVARWRRSTIQLASEQAWSGLLPPLSNDDAVSASSLRAQLRSNTEPAGFDERFAEVLAVQAEHPVLARRELRQAFLTAWKDVEDFTDDFRNDNFDGWPEDEEATPVAASPVAAVFAKPEAGLTPLELYDRWAPVASIQLEDRHRGYVQRLQEFLGPKPISQIEPDDLARFRVATLKFPNTKRPGILARPFNEIVEWGAGEGRHTPTLDEATVWKWINTAKQMFAYATKNRWIEINPAEDTMKKPAKKPFHSFRHTAIRALRRHGANTVLAYMLVGHEEGEVDRINLGYGEGADIRELKRTIDLIEYPTFVLSR